MSILSSRNALPLFRRPYVRRKSYRRYGKCKFGPNLQEICGLLDKYLTRTYCTTLNAVLLWCWPLRHQLMTYHSGQHPNNMEDKLYFDIRVSSVINFVSKIDSRSSDSFSKFSHGPRGMRKLNFLHDVKIFLWVQILVYLVSSLLVD